MQLRRQSRPEERRPEAEARDWQGEYEALEKAFQEYRAEVEGREALAAKRKAFRGLLREANIPERFHERILRLADVDALALDGDRLRDEDAAREAVQRDWGDYIAVEQVRGVRVDTPPESAGPPRPTVAQIMAIEDDARRERAIAVNHELFGF